MGDYEDRLTTLETKVSYLTTTLGELVEQLHFTNHAKASASVKRREGSKKKGVAEEDRDMGTEEVDSDSSDAESVKERSGIAIGLSSSESSSVVTGKEEMYSSGNPTNIANPIKDVSVQIEVRTIGGRLTLYQTTLCEKLPLENIDVGNNLDPQGYLEGYNVKDIQLICCQSDASTVWLVPPLVQARFALSLDQQMRVTFSWVLTRDRPKGKEVVKYEITQNPPPKPWEVEQVLNGTANSFCMYGVYPKYFRLTGSGEVRDLEQATDKVSGDLVLNRGIPEWWSFHDMSASAGGGCGRLTGPMAIIISEETPPQGILGDTLSKFSIWSLYISFVLAVGRFIRLQCSDLRMRIPFENLPSCNRLIAICEDIYAARAEGELEVEEVLYWTLVKIYRSPHMLLEYTNPD
ncbi:hypothetical protein GIB67_042174 [Kingdonia uniflora]|uniref:Piezo non-specific cation channel cap domain-containing protein n=1 Tax=Kingdonia uniflora TaxID=39325 RepID=A0A7J7NWX6_9MAGN|nr:hypothetical protein GIB67_042174 [Kingdonia uniflora]